MNDNFTYNRSWVEIEEMLDKAERKQNSHFLRIQKKGIGKEKRIHHMRNYKALEGVIKALRWTLGDRDVEHPLE